jgi:DNA-binding transcriptional ArsR family regulator
MSMESDHIDWNSVFNALADDVRRSIMQYLVRTNGHSSVDEIAAELSGRNGPTLDELADGAEPSDLHVKLHHVHLPALVRANLIRWNHDSDGVTTTALTSRIPAVLITPRVLMAADQATPNEASD